MIQQAFLISADQAFLISADLRLHYLDSAVVGTIQLYGDHDGSQGLKQIVHKLGGRFPRSHYGRAAESIWNQELHLQPVLFDQ
jgi:hypothetical protein